MPETQLVPMLGDYEAQFREAIEVGLDAANVLDEPSLEDRLSTMLLALGDVLTAYRWDIVGAKEAAAILGVSKSRFHELKARGDLPSGKQLADKVVYRGEDIRAYAAQRRSAT